MENNPNRFKITHTGCRQAGQSGEIDRLVNTISNIDTAKAALGTMWKRQSTMFDRLTKVEISLLGVVKPDNTED